MTAVFQVKHVTEYLYEQPVTSSYGQLYMLPRNLPGQVCRESRVMVEPAPMLYRERSDYFGNRVSVFALHEPHRRLAVTATSVVEVTEGRPELTLASDHSWERDRATLPPATADYLLPSPRIPIELAYGEYALQSFTAGRPLVEALTDLNNRVHAEFVYTPVPVQVVTPIAEAFARRRGSSQDLAHVMIAALRAIGLPARYVSGYLNAGQTTDRVHAWVSVFAPASGWIAIDPLNGRWVTGDYVVTAIGRDHDDVPPMSGVVYTGGTSDKLEVTVEVTELA